LRPLDARRCGSKSRLEAFLEPFYFRSHWMYPMYRCASFAVAAFAAAALALPASAQNHRQFPADALRGSMMVVQTPDVELNGQPARLAPGARIRGDNNLFLLSGSITGQKRMVHYTLDPYGLLKDVWVLNPVEMANSPWPETPEQAANWAFDSAGQVWTKR
jgi:hypothetical protein